MKTTSAPANAWEIRMKWGDRSLEAEVVDGRGRKTLSLGEQGDDDFVIGAGAKIRFHWVPHGLEVRFSAGVTGTASLQGEGPLTLAQLVERKVAREAGEQFVLTLGATDSLSLQVSGQVIDVKQARGRITRLRFDVFAATALVVGLLLLALWIGSTILPMQPLNLIPKTTR